MVRNSTSFRSDGFPGGTWNERKPIFSASHSKDVSPHSFGSSFSIPITGSSYLKSLLLQVSLKRVAQPTWFYSYKTRTGELKVLDRKSWREFENGDNGRKIYRFWNLLPVVDALITLPLPK